MGGGSYRLWIDRCGSDVVVLEEGMVKSFEEGRLPYERLESVRGEQTVFNPPVIQDILPSSIVYILPAIFFSSRFSSKRLKRH